MTVRLLAAPAVDLISKSETKGEIPAASSCDPKPKSVKWAFPADYTFQSEHVRKLIVTVQEVSQSKVQLPKGRVAKCFLIAKIIGNLASYFFGCKQNQKSLSLHAATLLLHQRAWSLNHNADDLKQLKNETHWKNTVYAPAPSLLPKARADLFAAKEERLAQQVSITTPDKVMLDGIFFPTKSKHVILLAMGLTGMYEECAVDYVYKSYVSFFKKEFNNPNILMVNTRGINLSQGFTAPQTLQVDIFTAYQFLVQHYGFDVEDVLVWGHSLGGCYGLQGAALMQQEHPSKKISAVVERTFLNLSEVAGTVFGAIICANGLEMCSKEAADQLKGSVVTIVSKQDTIIPYALSFAKKYKPKQNNFKIIELEDVPTITTKKAEKKATGLTMDDHHIRKFRPKEVEQITAAVKGIFDKNFS